MTDRGQRGKKLGALYFVAENILYILSTQKPARTAFFTPTFQHTSCFCLDNTGTYGLIHLFDAKTFLRAHTRPFITLLGYWSMDRKHTRKAFYIALLFTDVLWSENLCIRGKHKKQTTRLISHLVAFTTVARVRTFNITIQTRLFCAHEKKRGDKLYGRKKKIWALL